jgi:putative membrane protein insertion efficiency factor
MLAIDVSRPPARQLSARILVTGIRAYQTVGHQLFPPGQCRFSPTCSRYAEIVIHEHGAIKGGWLTVKRLLRCGPWTPKGTKDPPPPGN